MANEIFQMYTAAQPTYFEIMRPSDGFFWDRTLSTPAFVAYNSANWDNYAIAAADSPPGFYFATFPASIPIGTRVLIFFYVRVGGSRLPTDTQITYTPTPFVWDGFQLLDPSGIFDRGVLGQSGDGITSVFDAGSLTQQVGSDKIGTDFTGQILTILKSTGNAGMYAIVTMMTGTNDNIAHFSAWVGGQPPAGNVIYQFSPGTVGSGSSFPSVAPNNWLSATAFASNALAGQAVGAAASVTNVSGITGPILAAMPNVPFPSANINGTPTLQNVTFSGTGFIVASHAYDGRRLYVISGPNQSYLTEPCLAHTVTGTGSGAVHAFTFAAPEDRLLTTGDIVIILGK